MRVLGIDEAGRGCVLGDLVVGAFCIDDPDDLLLREAGADDSKRLSPAKRVAARSRLEMMGLCEVVRITPAQIDAHNLNRLEENAILSLIASYQPDAVYIDALGHPNAMPALLDRLQSELAELTDCRPSWVMEPKADRTYPVVGAASILAKTTRDAILAEHAEAHGALGSGYPSDPKTRAWLLAHAATRQPWPAFVRTRWATVQALAQQSLL